MSEKWKFCHYVLIRHSKNANFNVYSGHYFQCNETLMRTGSVKIQNNKKERQIVQMICVLHSTKTY